MLLRQPACKSPGVRNDFACCIGQLVGLFPVFLSLCGIRYTVLLSLRCCRLPIQDIIIGVNNMRYSLLKNFYVSPVEDSDAGDELHDFNQQ